MTQEVALVDRVTVDGLDNLGEHVAIAATVPLKVSLLNRSTKAFRSLDVHGFTASGQPLVLNGTRLVQAFRATEPDETVHNVYPVAAGGGDPTDPVGPFTPAPAGMTAVLSDGNQLPVVYYDVHGRACAIDREPISRALFVLEEDDGLVRIDLPPSATE